MSKVWREREKNQQDATIKCLLSTCVSTCFGHHYAHFQEIKDSDCPEDMYCCRVYCCSCLVCIVVILCVFVILCVCVCVCVHCFFFTLDAGLLARSQYSEGPATGHLDTGFTSFPCAQKQMLRWFPRFQVASTCFLFSPPDLNLVVTNFIFCIHVK